MIKRVSVLMSLLSIIFLTCFTETVSASTISDQNIPSLGPIYSYVNTEDNTASVGFKISSSLIELEEKSEIDKFLIQYLKNDEWKDVEYISVNNSPGNIRSYIIDTSNLSEISEKTSFRVGFNIQIQDKKTSVWSDPSSDISLVSLPAPSITAIVSTSETITVSIHHSSDILKYQIIPGSSMTVIIEMNENGNWETVSSSLPNKESIEIPYQKSNYEIRAKYCLCTDIKYYSDWSLNQNNIITTEQNVPIPEQKIIDNTIQGDFVEKSLSEDKQVSEFFDSDDGASSAVSISFIATAAIVIIIIIVAVSFVIYKKKSK